MIQNLETAIASEQQAGADTSAIEELKGKMDSAKSETEQAKPDVEAQAMQADAQRNMTRAVSALTNLPAGVQAKAYAGAARQALYDYMKADESGKAAAYDKATDQLKESISAALETEGLDKWTRQTLEEMLTAIDEEGEGGYNVIKKSKEETVIYRRVQGGTPPNASRVRVTIDTDGKIRINNKKTDLNISIDNGEHANYFRNKRGKDAHIFVWEVPKWFDNLLRDNVISQYGYRTNPRNQGGEAPKIVDKKTPGLSYELSNLWLDWLEEYSTNGRIEK